MMISNQVGTLAAEGKTLFTSRHSLNAFSEPHPSRGKPLGELSRERFSVSSRTLELMGARKADCQEFEQIETWRIPARLTNL